MLLTMDKATRRPGKRDPAPTRKARDKAPSQPVDLSKRRRTANYRYPGTPDINTVRRAIKRQRELAGYSQRELMTLMERRFPGFKAPQSWLSKRETDDPTNTSPETVIPGIIDCWMIEDTLRLPEGRILADAGFVALPQTLEDMVRFDPRLGPIGRRLVEDAIRTALELPGIVERPR